MDFWYKTPPHILTHHLGALGWVYGGIATMVVNWRARRAYYAAVPVISVGNISVGGTGKTTLTEALAATLAGRHKQVAIVLRGYGGSIHMPTQVDTRIHTAAEVGDEAIALARSLHRQSVSVWVGRNRVAAVRRAEAAGATLIILDDGFQRRDVARDVDIVVIDAARGFGNGYCLPAGPLREPREAIARASFAVLIGEDSAHMPATWQGVPSYRLHLSNNVPPALRGKRVVAFAGIGRPQKFFNTLKATGLKLSKGVPFPDHHRYTRHDLATLRLAAQKARAELVTTPKDAARLPQGFATAITPRLTGDDWPEILNTILNEINR